MGQKYTLVGSGPISNSDPVPTLSGSISNELVRAYQESKNILTFQGHSFFLIRHEVRSVMFASYEI